MDESEIGEILAAQSATLDEIPRRLTALEIRVGLRADPALEARERPRQNIAEVAIDRAVAQMNPGRAMMEGKLAGVPAGVRQYGGRR
jgi:hypothetical protein